MGRLLAIDGLNIVRRVYEASPEPDSDLKAEIALRHAL
jgi:protein Xni